MSIKTIVLAIVIVGVAAAFFEGVPQKGWDWFENTPVGTKILSGGGEQNLPGPLRGLLDPSIKSNLTARGVVSYTNEQRANNGNLTPLHLNPKLSAAAEAKINDMFAQQYFEHDSPDGKGPADIIRASGYEYLVVGENLALGNFENDEILVQAWMDSPGHRANILNGKFLEIGVAVRRGEFEGKQVWLAVQEFGSPLSSCPQPQASIKGEIDNNRTRLAQMQSELQQKKAFIESANNKSEAEYNRAVSEYNNLARQINTLTDQTQEVVKDYNDRINEFNKCLESNT